MFSKNRPDLILLMATLFLVLFGVLILFSISAPISQGKFGNTYYYLVRQFLFGIIPGVILGFIFFKLNLDFLRKIAPILFVLNLILLVMVFLPKIGISAGGATRWLNMGFFSFQPSEFLKITIFLYLASWLNKLKARGLSKFYYPIYHPLLFLIILASFSIPIILQPDISTLVIVLSGAYLVYFLARTPLLHNFLIIAIGAGVIILLINFASYRVERFLVFLAPQTDPMGIGYQVKQALIAIGSGGVFGKGLGMSTQKFGFLPNPMSDSPFAIFAEETGFIGSFMLIFLFWIWAFRGFVIVLKAGDNFSRLLAAGIMSQVIFQAFFNIGSMLGILPLMGIPLPFISYGGSHIVTELIGVGILLNISKDTY